MKKQTPMKAIRAKCLDCSNGSYEEVRQCPIENCPLFAYRFGHRPQNEDLPTETSKNQKPMP